MDISKFLRKDELFSAAEKGDVKLIKRLITSRNVDKRNAFGCTALMMASLRSQYAVVKILLKLGADPIACDRAERSILLYSLFGGNKRIIKAVLKNVGKKIDVVQGIPFCLGQALLLSTDSTRVLKYLLKALATSGKRQSYYNDALVNAAALGNKKAINLLLAFGADINGKDFYTQDTPLLSACWKNQTETVKYLVMKGADINYETSYNYTPLNRVIENGNLLLFHWLVDKGARPGKGLSYRNSLILLHAAAGKTNEIRNLMESSSAADEAFPISIAIKYAASKGWLETVRYLNEKTDIGNSESATFAFVYSAREGHTDILSYFLESEMDPDSVVKRGDLRLTHSALSEACYNGHLEAAKLLINNGANVNDNDNYFGTPLHGAVAGMGGSNEKTQLKIIRLLLQSGAEVEAQDSHGHTPITLAMNDFFRKPFLQLLLSEQLDRINGDKKPEDQVMEAVLAWDLRSLECAITSKAPLNIQDKTGKTPLMYAVLREYRNLVSVLCEAGADLSLHDDNGLSALHYAILAFNVEICITLLDHGADINIIEKNGKTPLMFAASSGNVPAVNFLMKRGADLNVRDSLEGSTALIDALFSGKIDTAQALIKNGADVNLIGVGGSTPLIFAARIGDFELAELLLASNANVSIIDKNGNDAAIVAIKNGHIELGQKLLNIGKGKSSL